MWRLIYTWSDDLFESTVYVRSFEDILKYMEFLNSDVDSDRIIDSYLIVRLEGD